MACRTETKEIDGVEYSVTQWSAETALVMKFRIGKVIGPALAELMKTGAVALDDNSILNAVAKLMDTCEPAELARLLKDCITGVAKEGRKITAETFNMAFDADSLLSVYKVFVFVLQVNYGNFIKGRDMEALLQANNKPKK